MKPKDTDRNELLRGIENLKKVNGKDEPQKLTQLIVNYAQKLNDIETREKVSNEEVHFFRFQSLRYSLKISAFFTSASCPWSQLIISTYFF